MPDTSGLLITTVLDTKISEVENNISNTSSLLTTTVLNTKISGVENRISNHDEYINTPQFNKLTAESFAARLKQANLGSKTDFDNKLMRFNRKANKDQYLEVQQKLNNLITKDYNFSQVEIILQVMMDLKKGLFTNQHLMLYN